MVWLPDLAVAALILKRYTLLLLLQPMRDEQALGVVRLPMETPSKTASTTAMPNSELAVTSTLMVPVVPDALALTAILELDAETVRRTSM
jgi:hypothetical protein